MTHRTLRISSDVSASSPLPGRTTTSPSSQSHSSKSESQTCVLLGGHSAPRWSCMTRCVVYVRTWAAMCDVSFGRPSSRWIGTSFGRPGSAGRIICGVCFQVAEPGSGGCTTTRLAFPPGLGRFTRSHINHPVLLLPDHLALKSDNLRFFQNWKPARAFSNPFSWPMLPACAPDILSTWRTYRYQRQLLNYTWLQAIHFDQDCELVPEVRQR